LSGKYFSFPLLPATPKPPSRILEGLCELKSGPSRAINSIHELLLELQRIKDTVRCGVPRTQLRTTDVNLNSCFFWTFRKDSRPKKLQQILQNNLKTQYFANHNLFLLQKAHDLIDLALKFIQTEVFLLKQA